MLSQFPELDACVRRLAAEHRLADIPKLTSIFALPEGVPPEPEPEPEVESEPEPLDADFEPEPEPMG